MNQVTVQVPITLIKTEYLSEQEVRTLLDEALLQVFQKDQQIYELKRSRRQIDRLLLKLLDLFIAGNYSKLHAELKLMAEYLQEQRAAQAAARRMH